MDGDKAFLVSLILGCTWTFVAGYSVTVLGLALWAAGPVEVMTGVWWIGQDLISWGRSIASGQF
jgi:hypothetical protein